jgi:hypothetical protein
MEEGIGEGAPGDYESLFMGSKPRIVEHHSTIPVFHHSFE